MLRAAFRPAVATATAAAAAAASSAPAQAEASSGLNGLRTPHLVNPTKQSPSYPASDASSHDLGADWDLVDNDGNVEHGVRFSLGRIPAREEVEEATRELFQSFQKSASHQESGGSNLSESEIDSPLSNTCTEPLVAESDKTSVPFAQSRGVDSVFQYEQEPDSFAPAVYERSTALAAAPVDQLFQLMQTDPEVRETVHSLALDPALWEAFNRNEAVQRLIRSRRMAAQGRIRETDDLQPRVGEARNDAKEGGFRSLFDDVSRFFQQVMGAVGDLVSKIFGLAEQQLLPGKSAGNGPDAVLKACMAVAILVLSVVVLKRSSH